MLPLLDTVRRSHASLPAGILPPRCLCPETAARAPVGMNVITFFAAAATPDVSIRLVMLTRGWGSFTAHDIHLVMIFSILAS